MATLTGNAINTSYQGLIKLDDNGAVDPTVLKQITDGTGGSLPIQVSQVQTKFQSLVDFTDATVSGLPVAEAGLVAGTATDSMKNADSLVTNAATASGPQSIALGNGAVANNNQSIAIGNYAESTSIGSAAVGEYASANGIYSSAWGRTSYARADGSVAFGQQAGVNAGAQYAGAVSMGRQVVAVNGDTTHVRALYIVAPDGGTGGNGITFLSPNGTEGVITLTDLSELAVNGTPIGGGGGAAGLINGTGADSIVSAPSLTTTPALAPEDSSIAIGNNAVIEGTAGSAAGVAIGHNVKTIYSGGISIGKNIQQATAEFNASKAISIGDGLKTEGSQSINIGTSNNVLGPANSNKGAIGTSCTVSSGVSGNFAIGNGVTASKAETVSVKELETTVNGGGVIMHSPNGTEYKLTVSDAGALVITAV